MRKNMIEEHHKETPRGHFLRADIPGPGKVLARYLENGEQTWEEHESNPNKRCTVNVPKDIESVTLIRPNLYRLHSNIKKVKVASERVFIDANYFDIDLLTAHTNDWSYIDTAEEIAKLLVADANIQTLDLNGVSNIFLIDCKVEEYALTNTKGLLRIES